MSKLAVARPIRDHIIVEPIEAESTSPGGILIPDVAKEKSQRARVLAVGSGRLLTSGTIVPLEVSDGDEIVYSRYGGTEVDIEGEKYVILREDDVLAIL